MEQRMTHSGLTFWVRSFFIDRECWMTLIVKCEMSRIASTKPALINQKFIFLMEHLSPEKTNYGYMHSLWDLKYSHWSKILFTKAQTVALYIPVWPVLHILEMSQGTETFNSETEKTSLVLIFAEPICFDPQMPLWSTALIDLSFY